MELIQELFWTRPKKLAEQITVTEPVVKYSVFDSNQTLVNMQNMFDNIDEKKINWKNESWIILSSTVSNRSNANRIMRLETLLSKSHFAIRSTFATITDEEIKNGIKLGDKPVEIEEYHIVNNIDKFIEIINSTNYYYGVNKTTNEIEKKMRSMFILYDNNPSITDVLKCENMEIRQQWLKKYGFSKLRDHATIIDQKGDYILFDLKTNFYTTIKLGRWLKMLDASTSREYILRVPENKVLCGELLIPIITVEDALAWSFDMPSGDYNPTRES